MGLVSDQQKRVFTQFAHDDAPVDALRLDGYTVCVDTDGGTLLPDGMDEFAGLQAIAKRVGVVADVRKAGEAEVDLGLCRGQAAGDRDGEHEGAVEWGRT